MRLWVALAVFVLGRTRRCNEAGIDHGAGLERQALLGQARVDDGQRLRREFVFVKQVAKPRNSRLIRQARGTIEADEVTVQGPLVHPFLPRWIADVPPQRQTMDAQHELYRKRRAFSQDLVRATLIRLNERYQCGPGSSLTHLAREDLFARLLVQRIKAQCDLIHDYYLPLPSGQSVVAVA